MMRAPARTGRCAQVLATVAVLGCFFGPMSPAAADGARSPRLPDEPLPFVEAGDRPPRTGSFIGPGRGINETDPLSPGIGMPSGAVWQPAFRVYGSQWIAVPSTGDDRRTRPGDDPAMVREEMLAAGFTKTHRRVPGSSGVRLTGLWAFDHVNRSNDAPDKSDGELLGLFTEGDFLWGLLPERGVLEADVARTFADRSRGEQVSAGLGWTGHAAGNNYSAHANFSRHFDPMQNAHDDGSLLVLGYSTELGLRRDVLYANAYWGEGEYRRPASSGGPPILGPVGLSFSSAGPGDYRPALLPNPLHSTGFAVGMQTFFAEQKANWAVELGHREDLDEGYPRANVSGTALTTRAQYSFADRFVLQLDAYYAVLGHDSKGRQDHENDDDSSALRVELRVNF